MNAIKSLPTLLSLVCLGIALLLAHRYPTDQNSLSGNLEEVSTILWTSDSRSFYPNLPHLHQVEKDELLGWTLDSSQYQAAQSLLQHVREGEVDASTLETYGLALGIENPLALFALPGIEKRKGKPQSPNSTIPSIDDIRKLEFTLDSLRRVWNQSDAKSGQREVLFAIQAAEFHLNKLKKRRESSLLESNLPTKVSETNSNNWNYRRIKTLMDSLLEQNRVFAFEPGVFIAVPQDNAPVSYNLVQRDPQWVRFIPESATSLETQLSPQQHMLRSPNSDTLIPIEDIKLKENTWLLKLPNQSMQPKLSRGWTIVDQHKIAFLKRWITWRR